MIHRMLWQPLVLLLLLAQASQAQILIGQTAGFSGPVAAGVMETTQGARLYINAINAKGGVRDCDSLPDCWGAERFRILNLTVERK